MFPYLHKEREAGLNNKKNFLINCPNVVTESQILKLGIKKGEECLNEYEQNVYLIWERREKIECFFLF